MSATFRTPTRPGDAPTLSATLPFHHLIPRPGYGCHELVRWGAACLTYFLGYLIGSSAWRMTCDKTECIEKLSWDWGGEGAARQVATRIGSGKHWESGRV